MSKKIAILATHGFEESELQSPKEFLEQQGWTAHIVSPDSGTIKAWAEKDWGKEYTVDKNLNEANASDYDALVLPGGVINPDQLRTNDKALHFVQDFFQQKKPVAAICHGPQILINAKVVDGKNMTSVNSISEDLKNAGALWEDKEVVVDNGLVTSRTPKDLPAFNAKMVEEIREGKHG
ncbi:MULTISPECIES: type 1 glutamine amidotransferase domain-containing protein [Chryseobacterium]|uniref:type 1 glutamine amidotransferase domain-containing protein n=1 Tax=Chryseobacterium TaxID=59732 RepID=UPI0015554A81|nr:MULTISPECIES: type 1 glutamine amidotransferase domain-containing protein [unclassified Chryseobacterium]MDC8104326.1 type 1 glutamine amidotransferase [Chryseobacterium sp. B21-037]MDQ1803936.1 type 1 glutamine amidotransferase domain-containing protein [Chryseobacterium sp. CKR4-1]WBV57859.1 type 1 glutamine amidotransferase [Chryseobacterium daecheongense]